MAEFASLRFLVFLAMFGLLVYLQFYLAHRQWRKLKGEQAGEINVNYVRSENYFAQSFRLKVKDWLKLPGSEDDAGPMIVKGQEKIRVLGGGVDMGTNERVEDILVIDGDLSCGPGCIFTRELLVHGNANVAARSRLQSLATDGDLMLGENVSVARWLDGSGEVTMSAGCHVGARVTSLERIRLGLGVEVSSASAPEVATAGWDSKIAAGEPVSRELLNIDFLEDPKPANKEIAAAGLQPDRILQLGEDTWLYNGDLLFSTAVRIMNKLVVKGNCYFPEGSVLESDVKAAGSLILGSSCSIHGHLVADGHVFLGPGCQFGGLIHAGKTMLLSRGSRGFCPNGMVAVYAQEGLNAEADVAVKGKLASGHRVMVVNAATAKEWRERRGISDNGSPLERRRKS